MLKRLSIGIVVLAAFAGLAFAEIPDYKNIKIEDKIGRAMRDIEGDDVELRRVATDDMKELAEKHIALLGVDGEALRAMVLLGDGIAELYWQGKPTSRMRAERLMDDVVKAAGKTAVSPDAVKSVAAQKLLARIASGLLRNPENPSAKKALTDIRAVLARANFSEEIAPAQAVATFLDINTATKAPAPAAEPAPVPAPTPVTAAAPVAPPPPAPEPAKAPAPPPADVPVKAAEPAPTPKQETVTVVAPQALQPKVAEPAPAAAPAPPPRVVSSGDWKYADPALKVTTVVAPKDASAPVESAASTPPPKVEPPKEAGNDGTSILNILLMQLKGDDERRLEAGLKLTSKTADVVRSNYEHGSDPRSVEIMKISREKLDHKSLAVKKAAMKACAALKDKSAAPKLIDLLVSGDESVSAPAYAALKEMSGLDLGPTRDAWDKWAASIR